MENNKLHIDELYPMYFKLVTELSRPFLSRLEGEELDDLTQTCWEMIVYKYPEFTQWDTVDTSVWITSVSRTALQSMVRESYERKRGVYTTTVSLDELVDGHGRQL